MAIKTVDIGSVITNAGVIEKITASMKPLTNKPIFSENFSDYTTYGHYVELCTFDYAPANNNLSNCILEVTRSFYENQVGAYFKILTLISTDVEIRIINMTEKLLGSELTCTRLFRYEDADNGKCHLYLYNTGGNGNGLISLYLMQHLDNKYFGFKAVGNTLFELPEGAVEITE